MKFLAALAVSCVAGRALIALMTLPGRVAEWARRMNYPEDLWAA